MNEKIATVGNGTVLAAALSWLAQSQGVHQTSGGRFALIAIAAVWFSQTFMGSVLDKPKLPKD